MCKIIERIPLREMRSATGYKIVIKNLNTNKYYSPSFCKCEIKVGNIPNRKNNFGITIGQCENNIDIKNNTLIGTANSPAIRDEYKGYTSVVTDINKIVYLDLINTTLNKHNINPNFICIPIKVIIKGKLAISDQLWGDNIQGIAGTKIVSIEEIDYKLFDINAKTHNKLNRHWNNKTKKYE